MLIDTTYLDKMDLSDPKNLAGGIAKLLDEKKGIDVTVIDLQGKTIVAEYFVIASATSTTAVKALGDYVVNELEKRNVRCLHSDVDPKWVALGFAGVVVHVFYDELREFYSLERLWADGGNVKRFKETD